MKKLILFLLVLFIVSFIFKNIKAQEERIFNIDNYDYFIYKGKRLTFEGVLNIIIEERKNRFIEELKSVIFK